MFRPGDIVCLHADERAGGLQPNTWIGELAEVHGDPADESVEVTCYIKQLGRQQVTSFLCAPDELRETILTFEGPMCVVCKVPY